MSAPHRIDFKNAVNRLALILFAQVLFGQRFCLAQAPPQSVDSHGLFEFHSDFRTNLHHCLYQQAIAREGGAASRPEVDEDPAWKSAVEFYRGRMVARDLLFDHGMVALKNALEDQETSKTLAPVGALAPEIIACLEKASPVYRATRWGDDDRSNQRLIRAVLPLVDKHGDAISRDLARFYKSPWPDRAVRVDVSVYATWAGAYTTDDPTRITISSRDPANQEFAALEVLFHEASHGISDHLERSISLECKKQNVDLPRRDLWHAVLFYTTGQVVRRNLGDYQPYAYKNGLWKRAWPMYIGPLEKDWQDYLDGKTSFESAVTALVKRVGQPRDAGEERH